MTDLNTAHKRSDRAKANSQSKSLKMAAVTETRLIPVAFRLDNSESCSTAMGKNYDLRLSPCDHHFSSLDEETLVVTSQKY